MDHSSASLPPERLLTKTPTGIKGFDEITGGGLPQGRPTLVCGGAGCGKTLFGIEFLVRGAMESGEPGVLMAFEETADELAKNVASLGFDLVDLQDRGLLAIDYVHVERGEIEETGEYDLEGLFIRLDMAVRRIGARRVVLDTLEVLFSTLGNEGIIRSELRRMFRWLKERHLTAVITAERGQGQLTRHGLEEYVSDCVIFLDHRVEQQISTRRLRVVKYRGSMHGTNEYPFLIEDDGITVLPITSLTMDQFAPTERVSSGVPRLDEMLGGSGFYRGSSILVCGTAGTGKSSVAASFVNAACQRGERCLYVAFEESWRQIARNMASIGMDLGQWVDRGLLRFLVSRPMMMGLEMHLAMIQREVDRFEPQVVVVDPITTFLATSTESETNAMLTRLMDHLKARSITAMYTSLTSAVTGLEQSDVGVSSVADAWLLLRDIEVGGERNRAMHILKARGIAHSNQVREFLLTSHGIELLDVYSGPEGVLTGSARSALEMKRRDEAAARRIQIENLRSEMERKRVELDARLLLLRGEYEAEQRRLELLLEQSRDRDETVASDEKEMARRRGGSASSTMSAGLAADSKENP